MSRLSKKTVVVPVDFSGESVAAIRTALEFVEQPGDVHAIHVLLPLDVASPGVLWRTVDDESREKAVQRHFTEYLQKLEIADVTTIVEAGAPGLKIADYAKQCGAELIVIPSHGYHGVKRLLLGSTAERVIRHAECPVLVLRRSDAD